MQLTASLAFTATALVALFAASPVAAVDNRILVNYSGKSPTDFCNAWRCNCVNYVPKDSTLIFEGTYCNPGDFSGKNTNSQAKVFCIFENGKSTVAVNKHVAAASGATIAN